MLSKLITLFATTASVSSKEQIKFEADLFLNHQTHKAAPEKSKLLTQM